MSAAPWSAWRHLPDGHALVALGSNLGDRRGQLEDAVERLDEHPEVAVLEASCLHRTAPVGGPPGQGEFLNGALLLRTTLDPEQLLELLHAIEDLHGRERVVLNGPRTLDLDLLAHGRERRGGPGLLLPHPRLGDRPFVLAPLAELCPELELELGPDGAAPATPGVVTTVRGRLDALRGAAPSAGSARRTAAQSNE